MESTRPSRSIAKEMRHSYCGPPVSLWGLPDLGRLGAFHAYSEAPCGCLALSGASGERWSLFGHPWSFLQASRRPGVF